MERPCGSMRRLEPSSPDSRLPGLNYLPPLPVSNLTVRGCVRLWVCHHPLKKPSGDKSWILRNTSLVNDSFQEEWTSIWVSVLIVSSLRHHPGVLEYSISIDSHRTLHQTGGGGGQQRRSGDGGSLTWNLLFVLLTGYTCACLTASLCRDGMPFSRFHKDRKQKFLLLWFCVCSWTNMWTWEANLLSLPWVPDPSCCSDSMGLRDLVPKMGLFPPAMPQKSL